MVRIALIAVGHRNLAHVQMPDFAARLDELSPSSFLHRLVGQALARKFRVSGINDAGHGQFRHAAAADDDSANRILFHFYRHLSILILYLHYTRIGCGFLLKSLPIPVLFHHIALFQRFRYHIELVDVDAVGNAAVPDAGCRFVKVEPFDRCHL